MTNIVPFTGETVLELSPDNVLNCAVGGYPGGVFVVGYNEDGDIAFASSFAEAKDIIWLLENAKTWIIRDYGDE